MGKARKPPEVIPPPVVEDYCCNLIQAVVYLPVCNTWWRGECVGWQGPAPEKGLPPSEEYVGPPPPVTPPVPPPVIPPVPPPVIPPVTPPGLVVPKTGVVYRIGVEVGIGAGQAWSMAVSYESFIGYFATCLNFFVSTPENKGRWPTWPYYKVFIPAGWVPPAQPMGGFA